MTFNGMDRETTISPGGTGSIPANLLKATFVHLPGIGPRKEMRLWEANIRSWEELLQALGSRLIGPPGYLQELRDRLSHQVTAYERRDWVSLRHALPQRVMWRALRDFPGRTVYLDIETDLAPGGHVVTVVGLWDGERYRSFIQEDNLDALADCLQKYDLVVTYGGCRFDLPVLESSWGSLPFLHVDLVYPLRRLGLRGGLKQIEKKVGIVRPDRIRGLSGWDAVRLWRRYRHGDSEALEVLLQYNRADVVSLETLALIAYAGQYRALLDRMKHSACRGKMR